MMKSMKSLIVGLFLVCFVWVIAMNGQAALSALEEFDYSFGSINGQDGGYMWSGSWIASATYGRTYTVTNGTFAGPSGYALSISSPYLALGSGSAAAQASRMLSGSFSLNPASTTTYYFSTLVSILDDGTVNDAKYFPRFVDANTVALVSFGVGGNNRTRINTGSTSDGSTYMTEGSSFATATQYLAVGKLVLNPSETADEFYFSIIDSSSAVSTSEPVSWDVIRLVDLSGTVSGVAMYSAANAGTLNVDSFYFGTDYASVIDRIIIPETTSGIYRVTLTARTDAAADRTERNVVLSSAYGSQLLSAPIGTNWGTVIDYAVISDFCQQIELVPYCTGVELKEASVTRIRDLQLPRQSYVAIAEPNSNTVCELNPPTFRWPAMGGASYYTVVYKPGSASWNEAEEAVCVRDGDIQELFYRPADVLAPGNWEWKLQLNGNDVGGPYSFTVLADAPTWELDSWQDYYDGFATGHPRLLTDAAGLSRIGSNISGAMQTYGTLLVNDLTARINTVDTNSTVSRIARPITDYAMLGTVLSRSDFSAEALRRVNLLLEMDGSLNDDFYDGLILEACGFTYDYLYSQLTDTQRSAIRAKILALLQKYNYPKNLPRYLYQAHAWQATLHQAVCAAMAIWDEEPYACDYLQFVLPLYASLYPWFGGSDGGSAECAHYGLETDMLPALGVRQVWDHFCGFDLAGKPWFENTIWFGLYSFPNNVQSSWFGDNQPISEATLDDIGPSLFAALYDQVIPSAYAADYSARYLDLGEANVDKMNRVFLLRLMPLLYGPFNTQPQNLDLPLARVFRDTGVVLVNTDMTHVEDNITLEFRSSPYGGFAHAHADQNSFNIMAYGEKLIVDSGFYTSYHDEHNLGYAIQTRAHNTLLVDGEGQPADSTYGWGQVTAFCQGEYYVWMSGDAAAAYLSPALQQFDRSILFLKDGDGAFVIIYDELSAADASTHDYSWLLHLTAPPSISGQRATAVGAGNAVQVDWFDPSSLSFSVTTNMSPPPILTQALIDGGGFPNPLPTQWHLSADCTSMSGSQNFVTVLQIRKDEDAAEFVAPGYSGSTVTVGDFAVTRSSGNIHITRSGNVIADFAEDTQQDNPFAMLASETFDYSLGDINGQDGGSGWDGSWNGSTTYGRTYTVSSGTFDAPSNYELGTSGPYLAVAGGTATAQANRMLDTSFSLSPAAPTTYYFSTLVSVLNDGTSNDAKYFPRFVDSNTVQLVAFGIGGDNRERINIGSSTSGSASMTEGASFSAATQYLAVGKLVLNPSGTADEFYLSIYDASSTVPVNEPAAWGVTRFQDLSGTVAGIAFASASDAGTLNVDSFYLSTDYVSVITRP